MAEVLPGRRTADLSASGDGFVVFMIGMRVNRPWKLPLWWPVFTAMPRMLRYLQARPERGLLGFRQAVLPAPLLVQYWRSFDDLERFARDAADPHLEPWRQFNRRVGASGDVGIWHETYRVSAADVESVYANMPVSGLAAAFDVAEVGRRGATAAGRLGLRDDDTPPVPGYS